MVVFVFDSVLFIVVIKKFMNIIVRFIRSKVVNIFLNVLFVFDSLLMGFVLIWFRISFSWKYVVFRIEEYFLDLVLKISMLK